MSRPDPDPYADVFAKGVTDARNAAAEEAAALRATRDRVNGRLVGLAAYGVQAAPSAWGSWWRSQGPWVCWGLIGLAALVVYREVRRVA